jgi:chromate transporter
MAILGYQWLSNHNGPIARKIMIGVQYGAVALLAAATYSIAQGVVEMQFSIPIALCCFLFFLALTFWNVSPFYGFILFIIICFFLK